MTVKENEFIKQLRKIMLVAIGVAIPFMLTSIGNMVTDHFKIKSNQEAIQAIKGNYVSNDLLLLYVDQFRRANELQQEALNKQDVKLSQEISNINAQMDELMKDVYKSKTRGATPLH